MTADDSTPTRLADALLKRMYSERWKDQDLRALAQQAYLAGKHDGWDEGFDAGETDVMMHEGEGWNQPCIDNPYPVDGAAQ